MNSPEQSLLEWDVAKQSLEALLAEVARCVARRWNLHAVAVSKPALVVQNRAVSGTPWFARRPLCADDMPWRDGIG